jgi:hypothetical protein
MGWPRKFRLLEELEAGLHPLWAGRAEDGQSVASAVRRTGA